MFVLSCNYLLQLKGVNYDAILNWVAGEEPSYAGVAMSTIIDKDYGVGDVISLLWFKRSLPRYCTKFIEVTSVLLFVTFLSALSETKDEISLTNVNFCSSLDTFIFSGQCSYPCLVELQMCVMLCADHGPCVSGAHSTIVTARAGKDLVSCLVSGK
jgi:ATP citrate (pro-S)-lyase